MHDNTRLGVFFHTKYLEEIMRSRKLIIAGVVLFVLLFTACQPKYVIVPMPDHSTTVTITNNDIAGGFDLDKLNDHIKQDLLYDNVPGLITEMRNNEKDTTGLMKMTLSSRSITSLNVYIYVEFTGYQNTESTFIDNGAMKFTINAAKDGTIYNLNSYTAETITPLQVTTTANGTSTISDNITVSIPKGNISGEVGFDENGLVSKETIETINITETIEGTGATITIGNEEIPVDAVIENPENSFAGLFGGGYGTAQSPYLIYNVQQFKNINNDDFQEMLKSGNNDQLYFRLMNNIDLSGESGYVADFFSGHLDGNNKTITGSNMMPYIFHYLYGNTTISNLTIQLDNLEITRVFSRPVFKGVKQFTGIERGDNGTDDKCFVCAEDSLTITMDNVDFITEEGNENYYYLGDGNNALYQNGTTPQVFVLCDDNLTETFSSCLYTSNETGYTDKFVQYNLVFSDCDAKANFTGGASASGAAIFVGGQLYGTNVIINNCSYSGFFEGQNVGFIIANSSGCNKAGSKIIIDGVSEANTITPYGDKSSLLSSNQSVALPVEYINGGNLTGNFTPVKNKGITITGTKNNKITISGVDSIKAEEYQVKLYLPSMYWYDSVADISTTWRTDSNVVTFIFADAATLANTDIYVAKVLSSEDANSLKDSVQAFNNIEWQGTTKEGQKYAFITIPSEGTESSTVYLVLDYSNYQGYVMRYTSDGAPTDLNDFNYVKSAITLAKDSSNKSIAISELTTF